jgi:hypothetical protein
LLPAGSLDGLASRTGYRNVGVDLTALSTLLSDHWSTIANKTTLDHEALDHAALLAEQLLERAYGRQTHARHETGAALVRAQAFTVLCRTYGNLRRCVAFLEPDSVNELVPSLYKGRGRRGGRSKVEAEEGAVERDAASETTRDAEGGVNSLD